jgi:hypothetical protein
MIGFLFVPLGLIGLGRFQMICLIPVNWAFLLKCELGFSCSFIFEVHVL